MRPLAPAARPLVGAKFAIECGLELPYRRRGGLLKAAQRHDGDPAAAIAFCLEQVVTTVDGFPDRRLGLGIAGRGHCGAASPHNCVPGLTFQPVGLADLRLGRATNQNRLLEVIGMQPMSIPNALCLRLPVTA